MKKVTICISNDIIYDRRMLRSIDTLLASFEVDVICRKLHEIPAEIQGVNVKRIKCLFNRGFLFYMEFDLRLFFILLMKRFDILLAVDYDTIMPAAIIKKLKSKRLVFDAHEYFEESVEIVDRKKVQSFWKYLGKTYVKHADLAYTVSETIAGEYRALHGIHFQTIRNVPSLPRAEGGKERKPNVIIYQGVLNQGRKLELLISAGQLLGQEYQIWIVGEGDLSEKLKSIAGNNITFYSWVKPEQLYELTTQASLAYNLLETKSKSYFYSLANKFFDYVHAGVPSINNQFPEYLSINERYNCCITVDISSANELANLIRIKMAAKDELAEYRKNAKLAAKDLCWEKESKKLLALFENL